MLAGTAYRAGWQHGGDRAVAWRDVSTALGGVELHRPVVASFGRREELGRYLARELPARTASVGALDLSGREAILVALGARSSGGYEVEVLGVREERARLVVSARERTPSLLDPAAARLTFPYRLLEVAATGKHADVEWRGRP